MSSTEELTTEQQLVLRLWKDYNEWFAMQGYWDAEPTIQGFASWIKVNY